MPIKEGLEIFKGFIEVGKELAKLPALVLPQYAVAARDLYEICKKILEANENMARWFHRFRYFDFKDPNSVTQFWSVIQEYRSLRSGAGFKQLKFSCGDIAQIYHRDIGSKLGSWFSNTQKLEEVEGIFTKLTDADLAMVELIQDGILKELDTFLSSVETIVATGNLNDAEKLRLEFKASTASLTQQIERFGDELADLIIAFARVAKVPITL